MARNSFAFSHLEATAPEMAAVSRRFAELAMWIVANLPPSAERTVAVRKALPTCTADFDGLFSP